MKTLVAALALAPLLALAQGAGAGAPSAREDDGDFEEERSPRGYYLSLGVGSGDGHLVGLGDSRSLQRYMGASPTRVALSFEGGATVGERLLVGLDLTFFRASAREDDLSGAIQLLQSGLVGTVYPLERGPFLRAGAGLARLDLTSDGRGTRYVRSASGFGVLGGAGYALRVWRTFDASLRIDVTHQWLDAPEVGVERSVFWAAYAGVSWF